MQSLNLQVASDLEKEIHASRTPLTCSIDNFLSPNIKKAKNQCLGSTRERHAGENHETQNLAENVT